VLGLGLWLGLTVGVADLRLRLKFRVRIIRVRWQQEFRVKLGVWSATGWQMSAVVIFGGKCPGGQMSGNRRMGANVVQSWSRRRRLRALSLTSATVDRRTSDVQYITGRRMIEYINKISSLHLRQSATRRWRKRIRSLEQIASRQDHLIFPPKI